MEALGGEGTVKPTVSCQNGCVLVVDSALTHIYMVPSHSVVHLPPAKSPASRVMFCRNYKRFEADSCAMGKSCKFVHADVDLGTLKAQAIHVNYTWRNEEFCMYKRLPPGDFLDVLLPNGKPPAVRFRSEYILATRGAYSACKVKAQAPSHCAHYYFNYLCNRGEDCGFIHALYVDPNITEVYKRASGRSHRLRVPTALKLPTESAVNNNNPQRRPRQDDLTGLHPNPLMLDKVLNRGEGESFVPTVAAQSPNSWTRLNSSSSTSVDGPQHSSSGEEAVTDLKLCVSDSEPLQAAREVQCNGRTSDRRRCRVYRHDPYHSI
ncbi:uncharacterized protein Tco025E_07958 [Trypanosoma conorhini]|uniref:C3H1-type domain-containing protein n=1 Tax=Trypanosoma conorhini TaxID=83891 RepID=A0A422NG68_9TRYP|nr:uncharacterized protein Tco025E_07958 [Trypanosoma conorhini]RNF04464.1 hypothetical protein Tco025E_07958 [Trypanosoma conorhini]